MIVDIIKAFDCVPRDGLFAVLKKFGFPPKGLLFTDGISGKKVIVDSNTSVKQGCTLAPILLTAHNKSFFWDE